jgi:hypothetical protein
MMVPRNLLYAAYTILNVFVTRISWQHAILITIICYFLLSFYSELKFMFQFLKKH